MSTIRHRIQPSTQSRHDTMPARRHAAVWLIGLFTALLLMNSPPLLAAPPLIAHQLNVEINPDAGRIAVTDQMRLPETQNQWTVLLHRGLNPQIIDGTATLTPSASFGHLVAYRLTLHTPEAVTLRYSGQIQHALEHIDAHLGRTHQHSLGTIAPEGVFLDGGSGWYPRIPETYQQFTLNVQLPVGWSAVAQGAGTTDPTTGQSQWSESQPQDDLYLMAGRFQVYRQRTADLAAEAQVYLREPDAALAERYLTATLESLAFYSDLIGPYPFAKFALVENFWESGYGMPSFTVLGPQVMRLPFIVQTAYPHEILHNWWGNSVYIDYESGNWSEGLTNYLADYWFMERSGRGSEGRRDLLKNFADYVRQARDFPLTQFKQRHGTASQAIGYNKGAMVFHMLRRELGDEHFIQGLRRFYADHRFRAAHYADLRRAFETVSGRDLQSFFATWIERSGAPQLALADIQTQRTASGYRMSGRIQQTQTAPPYPLTLPLVIDLESAAPHRELITMTEREHSFDLALSAQPKRLQLDPEFEVFRALAPGELPITLSNLFGAEQGWILIPTAAPEPLRSGYQHLAERWQAGHRGWQIREDRAFDQLPNDRPVWLLGWENQHFATFAHHAADFTVTPTAQSHTLKFNTLNTPPFNSATDSVVLTRRFDHTAVAWMGTYVAEALPALARKLPHYGQYSYLNFSGAEATNQLKGQWPSGESALTYRLD